MNIPKFVIDKDKLTQPYQMVINHLFSTESQKVLVMTTVGGYIIEMTIDEANDYHEWVTNNESYEYLRQIRSDIDGYTASIQGGGLGWGRVSTDIDELRRKEAQTLKCLFQETKIWWEEYQEYLKKKQGE